MGSEARIGCDLLCTWRYTEILRCCYHLASAKQVALFFGVKSGKCDLLCAKQVALSSRVTTFQTLLTLRGQDSESNDPYLGRVRPALRKAGRTLAIGLRGSKKCRKMKVPRMTLAIVENVPTSWESIFKLFPASQRPYRAKIKKMTKTTRNMISPYFPYQTTWQLFSISETRGPEGMPCSITTNVATHQR